MWIQYSLSSIVAESVALADNRLQFTSSVVLSIQENE